MKYSTLLFLLILSEHSLNASDNNSFTTDTTSVSKILESKLQRVDSYTSSQWHSRQTSFQAPSTPGVAQKIANWDLHPLNPADDQDLLMLEIEKIQLDHPRLPVSYIAELVLEVRKKYVASKLYPKRIEKMCIAVTAYAIRFCEKKGMVKQTVSR